MLESSHPLRPGLLVPDLIRGSIAETSQPWEAGGYIRRYWILSEDQPRRLTPSRTKAKVVIRRILSGVRRNERLYQQAPLYQFRKPLALVDIEETVLQPTFRCRPPI